MTNINHTFKLINDDNEFTSKEICILNKNKKFFSSKKKYIDQVIDLIDGTSDISLRILDWFITNYSKKYNTFYKIKTNEGEENFYVNNEYHKQLFGYTKKYFDSFCRGRKIVYHYRAADFPNFHIDFITSIAQLNYFQWVIRNKILNYVKSHRKEIEKDMKDTIKNNKKIKSVDSGQRKITTSTEENEDIDHYICSSDSIHKICISSSKKSVNSSDSENKIRKRNQLSKSVYDTGIQKSTVSITLDFD
jgi:hypothetical protein